MRLCHGHPLVIIRLLSGAAVAAAVDVLGHDVPALHIHYAPQPVPRRQADLLDVDRVQDLGPPLLQPPDQVLAVLGPRVPDPGRKPRPDAEVLGVASELINGKRRPLAPRPCLLGTCLVLVPLQNVVQGRPADSCVPHHLRHRLPGLQHPQLRLGQGRGHRGHELADFKLELKWDQDETFIYHMDPFQNKSGSNPNGS